MNRMILLATTFALSLAAANIDGQWTGEVMPGGKNAANAQKQSFALNLKSQGDSLTGTVTVTTPKGKLRNLAIQDGKVTGDSFRFATVQKGKKGENKVLWSGSVKGDELSGSRGREGAKRAPTFTARRKV